MQQQQQQQNYSPTSRQLILNGRNVPKGRYPYYVSLDYHNGVVLSGVLVAPDVVLTAGHAFPTTAQDSVITARIGTYSLRRDSEMESYNVVQTVRHPQWTATSRFDGFSHDVALFRLAVNDTILQQQQQQPIALAKINRENDIPSETDVLQVLGLGWTNMTVIPSPADIVQMTDLTPLSNAHCQAIFDPDRNYMSFQGVLDETMLCAKAGPHNEHDSCGWDSGGPVIWSSSSSSDNDNDDYRNDVIVGLVSWGVDGCADPVFPSVYARVSAVSDWIESTVCQLSNHPPEDFTCPAAAAAPSQPHTVDSPVANQPSRQVRHGLFWPMQMLLLALITGVLLLWYWRRSSRKNDQVAREEQESLKHNYGSMEVKTLY